MTQTDKKAEEETAWENTFRDAGIEIALEEEDSKLGHVEITVKKGDLRAIGRGDSRATALQAAHTAAKSKGLL